MNETSARRRRRVLACAVAIGAAGMTVAACSDSTSAPRSGPLWSPPDPKAAASTKQYLAATGAPLPVVVTKVESLSSTPPPDVASCKEKAAELDADMTPGQTLVLAAQSPDPVLGELLVDLVSATGDALQACQGAAVGSGDPWAQVRVVLDYIAKRRAELGV